MQNTPIVFRNSVGSGTWVTRFRTSLLKKRVQELSSSFSETYSFTWNQKRKKEIRTVNFLQSEMKKQLEASKLY